VPLGIFSKEFSREQGIFPEYFLASRETSLKNNKKKKNFSGNRMTE
jgi:hypothetical protein